MAGIWPLSYTQCIGLNGRPQVGARAYFFEAGTTTPLQTYTDYTLAVPNPSYIETDGYGRWPAAFLDDSAAGFYRVRVTEANGTTIFDVDAQPIVGPNAGGGGDPPAPVDPDSLMKTGDIKIRYSTGVIAGFVRGNGRTIGSATSGASERANADTQPLYEYLWETDPDLVVSGGRGVSATADFEANKPMALPDFRGMVLGGLDGMGNSAAGRLPGLVSVGDTTGEVSRTLVAANIPTVTGTTNTAGAHTHNFNGYGYQPSTGSGGYSQTWVGNGTRTTESAGAHSHTVTVGNASPTSFSIVQPTKGITVYFKL